MLFIWGIDANGASRKLDVPDVNQNRRPKSFDFSDMHAGSFYAKDHASTYVKHVPFQ